MSVDLRSNSTFARVSVLVMDDCLIKLEHGRTEDRMRRVLYDSIRHVIIWRKFPWIRITVCAVLLGLPGIAMLLSSRDTFVQVMGAILLTIGLVLDLVYFYCRITTIRIVRLDSSQDITGLFRPGKVRRVRERLINAISQHQAASHAPPSNT